MREERPLYLSVISKAVGSRLLPKYLLRRSLSVGPASATCLLQSVVFVLRVAVEAFHEVLIMKRSFMLDSTRPFGMPARNSEMGKAHERIDAKTTISRVRITLPHELILHRSGASLINSDW